MKFFTCVCFFAVLCSTLRVVAQNQEESAIAKSYKVSGVVFFQKNKKPVSRAKINLFIVSRDEKGEILSYEIPSHAFPKETADDGKFSLTLSSEEEYMVSFIKEDYLAEPEVLFFGKKKISEGEHISITVPMIEFEGLLVHGRVTDNYRRSLENVVVTLVNLQNNLSQKVLSDKLGGYIFRLQSNATYRLVGEKEGYFIGTSHVFTTKKKDSETFAINLVLPKMEVGYQYRLEKFIFQVNDTTLIEEEKPLLEFLIKKLKQNPELKMEIACHSDARGDDTYNLTLSQQRAEVLKNYLVACGVHAHQLVAKGYGETKILNECKNGVRCPTEKHEENRRIIFEILGWE